MYYLWGLRLWSQSSQKCYVSKSLYDCDHDRSSIHKNILYLSLYKDCDHDHIPKRGLWPWSQSSQNILFLCFCEECDYDRSPHKMPYFLVSPHKLVTSKNKMKSAKRSIQKKFSRLHPRSRKGAPRPPSNPTTFWPQKSTCELLYVEVKIEGENNIMCNEEG